MAEYWFAVATKPRQEEKAELNLAQQGYKVYLPRLAVKKHRRDRWETVIEPLFPGYLFLNADPEVDDLAPVRSSRGVRHLVRFGNQPVAVPESIIRFLRANDAGCGEPAEPRAPFDRGMPVDILEGPFKGLSGVFEITVSEERAILLVTLLGRCNRIEINIHDIVPQS